jgi:aminoglycoside phosphotransferase family enzyme/predicted kinase
VKDIRLDPAQQEVIDFLSRPGILGGDPVERIDTHAAVIFLGGDKAYKLKRAVRYAYLDFSTVEKRKAVCEDELALNRRTAPDLYLEVRSVNRLPDGRVGFGDGVPLDWLVVMRRFAAASLLEQVAAHGGLDTSLVRALADEIARFHDAARVELVGDGAERVRRVIDGNRRSMAALPAGVLSRADCDKLHSASLTEWAKLAPLLERRAHNGHVRHCHGDLHLANICLWRGRPTLFDCLEFDAALATTDVLYDLGFLVMDLCERGYRAQASLLFNRYLDMRDEADGLAAMPLFLSMRAAVRAHVSGMAANAQGTAEKRRDQLDKARDYLTAATSFLRRERARLVAVGGLSGSGKSTLAGALAPVLGAAPGARWLRTDVIRKRLAGVAPEVRLPAQAYGRESNTAVYRRMLDEAGIALAAGRSVIVDGVFADAAERTNVLALAKSVDVEFTGIWLEAPRETLHSRVARRVGDASDADIAVVEHQLGKDLGELADWHRIEAVGTPEAVAARARAVLETP